ncbi:Phenylalanine--tRNA ligase alpha subunit [Alcanivorax sp. ALC70]|nr:Phenylalanine--tRNA ligase alpha subunit [Alcanivorax sp. ALC70]
MMENLESLVEAALAEVAGAADARALDEVRVRYLGKKGEISALLKSLGA